MAESGILCRVHGRQPGTLGRGGCLPLLPVNLSVHLFFYDFPTKKAKNAKSDFIPIKPS